MNRDSHETVYSLMNCIMVHYRNSATQLEQTKYYFDMKSKLYDLYLL